MSSRGSVVRISGIIFALTFLAAFFLLGEAFGAFGDSDAVFTEYYEDDRASDILGAVAMAVAAASFCVFAVYLTTTETRPATRTLLTIALACFAAVEGLGGTVSDGYSEIGSSFQSM